VLRLRKDLISLPKERISGKAVRKHRPDCLDGLTKIYAMRFVRVDMVIKDTTQSQINKVWNSSSTSSPLRRTDRPSSIGFLFAKGFVLHHAYSV
jgi:hypothetical protein